MERPDIENLKKASDKAKAFLHNCEVCPRKCHVNRIKGEAGYCKTANEIKVSSFGPHFGEEAPLVGQYGSGTIFLASCSLGCMFCQNYDISHQMIGKKTTKQEFSDMILRLQNMGCHNINLVTPTHVTPQIMEALIIAWEQGLEVPTVYNCGGYESVEMLKLLEGFVDIYMPDAKYSDPKIAEELSKTPDYFDVLKSALKEMHRQVGDLKLDSKGVAQRGLLIRHLVMPENYAGSKEIFEFIAKEISRDTYINVMDQYFPCHEAIGHPKIGRRITPDEFRDTLELAKSFGLHNFL